MTGVTSTVRSGDQDVDALLASLRWSGSLTYSFPTAGSQYTGYGSGQEPFDDFGALNGAQKAVVRQILTSYSAVANIDLTEVSGGAGDLRFGMTGGTDGPAHAYLPDNSPTGGDSWYRKSDSFYNPLKGTYGYHGFVHEIGHALGLKHPHDTDNFGTMNSSHDAMTYTVMSYRSMASGLASERGYTNEFFGYAQGPMMYDIAALQHMYGARYDSMPVDTVYRFDPATGEMFLNDVGQGAPGANRVFTTVWDGGGTDTYDLSAYAETVRIDLRPGFSTDTSDIQKANLGNGRYAAGNVFNAFLHRGDSRSLIENGIGGAGDDRLIGNEAGNRLDGGAGADSMAGGAGADTYVVDDAGDVIDESDGSGLDAVLASIDFELGEDLENLRLTGVDALLGAGNALANIITGNDASNRLDGRGGADTMRGGKGSDIYVVDNVQDRLFEQSGEGVDTVVTSLSYVLPSEVERLSLGGSNAVSGTGNELANAITGNAAANRIDGLGGADLMKGVGGNDIYKVDHVRDRIVEAAGGGLDQVRSSVSYALSAEVEALVLTGASAIKGIGNAQANTLAGNSARNLLDGGAGADRMTGGGGDDVYIVDNKADVTLESADAGIDRAQSSVSVTLRANLENLGLTGAAAVNGTGNALANAIGGNAGSNILIGLAGADRLTGGDGADQLHGGGGNDRLTGGEGMDRFFFDSRPSQAGGWDAILDFTAADDSIFLDHADFASIAVGRLAPSAFHKGAAAAGAEDRIIYDDASGQLFYDADGSGAGQAILFAVIDRGADISNTDFVIY